MDNEVRDLLTRKIKEKGFPVIAVFDCMDSCAGIWAKSETEVLVDEYGSNFVNDGVKCSEAVKLSDISEEGLFQLYDSGKRPTDTPVKHQNSYDEDTEWFG